MASFSIDFEIRFRITIGRTCGLKLNLTVKREYFFFHSGRNLNFHASLIAFETQFLLSCSLPGTFERENWREVCELCDRLRSMHAAKSWDAQNNFHNFIIIDQDVTQPTAQAHPRELSNLLINHRLWSRADERKLAVKWFRILSSEAFKMYIMVCRWGQGNGRVRGGRMA